LRPLLEKFFVTQLVKKYSAEGSVSYWAPGKGEANQASAPPLGFKANKNLRNKEIHLTLIHRK
jgi:hypothetical protein